MNITRLKRLSVATAVVVLAACTDSTGSGEVTSEDAFRSLARGFGDGSGLGLPFGMSASALGNGSGLGQVSVTLDGVERSMYALGLRVTYPAGTCFESLVIIPPSQGFPAGCSPPPLGLLLVMWQTRSGSRPPDRMVLVSADVGTANFDFLSTAPILPGANVEFPSFAIYIDNRNEEIWGSIAGTLTSHVTATNQTCAATRPPFARTATCHFATFDEEGHITFEEFDVTAFQTPGLTPIRTTELVIPRQNITGILQAITEIQPVTFPSLSAVRGF